jgi:hypothetical protein
MKEHIMQLHMRMMYAHAGIHGAQTVFLSAGFCYKNQLPDDRRIVQNWYIDPAAPENMMMLTYTIKQAATTLE